MGLTTTALMDVPKTKRWWMGKILGLEMMNGVKLEDAVVAGGWRGRRGAG